MASPLPDFTIRLPRLFSLSLSLSLSNNFRLTLHPEFLYILPASIITALFTQERVSISLILFTFSNQIELKK